MRDAGVLLLFFVNGYGVVLKIDKDFDFSIPGIFRITLYTRLFEVSIEPKHMPIESDPVGLVELSSFTRILGVEVIMRS